MKKFLAISAVLAIAVLLSWGTLVGVDRLPDTTNYDNVALKARTDYEFMHFDDPGITPERLAEDASSSAEAAVAWAKDDRVLANLILQGIGLCFIWGAAWFLLVALCKSKGDATPEIQLSGSSTI